MIIYICGPITGKDFKEVETRFLRTEEWLKQVYGQGECVVLNPIKTPSGLTQESYMDISFAQIRASDALYVLKGYENSEGCMAEVAYAKKIKKVLAFQP